MPVAKLTQEAFSNAGLACWGSRGGVGGYAATFSCGLILHRKQAGLLRGFVQPRSI
jgi:hypothetical protein